jgi:hypothetical protein
MDIVTMWGGRREDSFQHKIVLFYRLQVTVLSIHILHELLPPPADWSSARALEHLSSGSRQL